MFTYKGSEGNSNRFITFEECMNECFLEEKDVEVQENNFHETARNLNTDISEYFKISADEICHEDPPEGLCNFNEGILYKLFFQYDLIWI